ncbi:MAG: hypothetical protein AAGA03_13385, partial [Planctomycetota bacterium]
MTRRQPKLQPASSTRRSRLRTGISNDRRSRARLQKRQSLLQSLEPRQLLAGPDLIGVQPNDGSLLFESPVLDSDPTGTSLSTLSVAPRELVFRFDDDANLDEDTLSAIRITRAGEDKVFESASASSDLGTGGDILLEFRSAQEGTIGNGIEVVLTSSNRNTGSTPLITVEDRRVTVDLNSNPVSPTRAQEVVNAINNNDQANDLVNVIQISGPTLGIVGTTVGDRTLVLRGANAAQAVTDFNTAGATRVRLVSQLPGVDGRGIRLDVETRDFGGPANPVVVVTDQRILVQLNSADGFETTAGEFIDAINNNPDSARLVVAVLEEGELDVEIGSRPTTYSPLNLSGVSDVLVEPGYVGLGDTPREVVFRFAEPLPDDTYQIDILGTGPLALQNVDGDNFQDGQSLSRKFEINLGPKVAAVVPEPVRRQANGSLSPETGKIEVHFNDDDLDPTSARNVDFYQLIFTKDTINNTDDEIVTPQSVVYNSATNIATLDFGVPLSRIDDPDGPGFLSGAARLRVGSGEDLPQP